MRVLVLHAHPDPEAFSGALYRLTLEELTAAGHEVQGVDLYAEGFSPVLSGEEWRGYVDVPGNRIPVSGEVARLQWAEALVFVYPVWNFGFPAILKGYLDRVFLPGVTFHLTSGRVAPGMQHVRHLLSIATYGAPRWWAIMAGDAPRHMTRRVLRVLIHPRGRAVHVAHYAISQSTPASRTAFVDRVRRAIRAI